MELETYNKTYFDGRQKRGVLTLSNLALLRFMDKTLTKLNAPRNTALEIGCAYGEFTQALLGICQMATGVDISQHAIDEGKKRHPELNLQLADFDNAPLPESINGQMDVIVSLHTFEHFQNPEAALEKTYQALSRGGTLFLVVPNPEIWVGKALGLIGKKKSIPVFGDQTHISLYSQKKWLKILHETGFKTATFGRPFYVVKHPMLDKLYKDNYYTKFLQRSGFELLFVCQKA